MKKYTLIAAALIISVLSIGAAKLSYPNQGEYAGKLTSISKDDFFKPDNLFLHFNDAVLVDTKPDEITIDPGLKLNNPKYGSVMFGDNNKRSYFVMSQDKDGYWMDYYLDQNLDYKITPEEKLKNIEKWNLQKTTKHWDLMESAITIDPIQMVVSYKGSTAEIKKNLNFYLWIKHFTHKGENDETYVTFATVSAFEGFMKVLIGKDEKLVKYRITDANCNGCFNDYGKDNLYLDLNFDGYFSIKEVFLLYEFFDQKIDKTSTQMRFSIPACPAKIVVAPAAENINTIQLEAKSDN
jgi:hypothetical protein